jgi:hypothetical protein
MTTIRISVVQIALLTMVPLSDISFFEIPTSLLVVHRFANSGPEWLTLYPFLPTYPPFSGEEGTLLATLTQSSRIDERPITCLSVFQPYLSR